MALVVSGCSRSGPKRFEVTGTASYAGRPVEVGTIRLVPVDGTNGPLCGGNIENGRFRIPREGGPVVGRHRVEIEALEKTGQRRANMGGELFDDRANVLPPKYSGPKSELFVEISPDRPNDFPFDLQSP